MPGMETETDHFTRRYERIMTGLFATISANNLVFPLWLNPLFDRLVLKGHCRALKLLGQLFAGLYRPRHPRTAPRPNPERQSSDAAKPAAARPRSALRLPTTWKWLARALPSPMWEAARVCAAELQQFLCEPDSLATIAAAPALRHHLRPLCRALGVTLPGEPKPPDADSPEPPPPPAVKLPMPEIGDDIHGREPEPPPPTRWTRIGLWSDEVILGCVTIGR
jgi:hypothetical protein